MKTKSYLNNTDFFQRKEITLLELKEIILTNYFNTNNLNDIDISRELIITEIKDNHETVGTIIFSISGSPPKGVAVLLSDGYSHNNNFYSGFLYISNRYKFSKGYYVHIKKEVV